MQQVDTGLKRALITYGTARLLHGAVSVLQGTQIDAAPAGIGATFSPGQILAPAAELLKQFSDLMLIVCVSFGIQKLIVAIGGFSAISFALTLVAIYWLFRYARFNQSPKWLTKIFLVLVVVRFAVPLTVIGSNSFFQTFMAKEYSVSQNAISTIAPKPVAQNLAQSPELPRPGIVGTLKSWITQKSSGAVASYVGMKDTVERAAENVVTLIAIFILQTVVIPLLMLLGLWGIAKVILQFPLTQTQREKP